MVSICWNLRHCRIVGPAKPPLNTEVLHAEEDRKVEESAEQKLQHVENRPLLSGVRCGCPEAPMHFLRSTYIHTYIYLYRDREREDSISEPRSINAIHSPQRRYIN